MHPFLPTWQGSSGSYNTSYDQCRPRCNSYGEDASSFCKSLVRAMGTFTGQQLRRAACYAQAYPSPCSDPWADQSCSSPCASYRPCGPCVPNGPCGPCGPAYLPYGPGGVPCGPWGPCGPAGVSCVPWGPCGPTGVPCGPCGPCGPATVPCGPCGPCGPSGPCVLQNAQVPPAPPPYPQSPCGPDPCIPPAVPPFVPLPCSYDLGSYNPYGNYSCQTMSAGVPPLCYPYPAAPPYWDPYPMYQYPCAPCPYPYAPSPYPYAPCPYPIAQGPCSALCQPYNYSGGLAPIYDCNWSAWQPNPFHNNFSNLYNPRDVNKYAHEYWCQCVWPYITNRMLEPSTTYMTTGCNNPDGPMTTCIHTMNNKNGPYNDKGLKVNLEPGQLTHLNLCNLNGPALTIEAAAAEDENKDDKENKSEGGEDSQSKPSGEESIVAESIEEAEMTPPKSKTGSDSQKNQSKPPSQSSGAPGTNNPPATSKNTKEK